MKQKKKLHGLKLLFGLLLAVMLTTFVVDQYSFAAEKSKGSSPAESKEEYNADRPLLMKGKSLVKASAAANVGSLAELKTALAGSQNEIYINNEIVITEDMEIPSGKLLLRGYNGCYGTMFRIPDGVTVTVRSDIDASGDQTRIYTGPVFQVAAGGTLKILSGSIYGSVSSNDGGAIVNQGTTEIKGGTLQGHTTTKRGGAIYNEGNLTISGGQISDNRAMAAEGVNAGGAVYNSKGGTLSLAGGISLNNYSLGNGGAIYNEGILTIDKGRIDGNKAQKKGNGIYSTEDITYIGKYYVNLDEVISEKNVSVLGSSFQNASVITAVGFQTDKAAGNNGNGKLTCTALTGDMGNDGQIYYNGEGSFTGKVTGTGQFHTSKILKLDAPAFSNHLTVDKGEVTVINASMEKHDITVSSGILKSGSFGTVKVRNISISSGTYVVENASIDNQAGSLADCTYLDAENIRCLGSNAKLTVNGKNAPVLDGKETFYVPVGKRVQMSQTDIRSALILNSGGQAIEDGGKYGRSLHQEGEATYIKIMPAELYELKVLFLDAEGNQQIFFENGAEKVSVSLWTENGYSAAAKRIPDSEGFQTAGNDNFGGYQFASVPRGKLTVSASFTDRKYRSVSGRIDLQKDDTIILRPQKVDVDPQGVWWTDEGNYDVNKYNELKSAQPEDTIEIKNARELAAVSKIVAWPANGADVRNLSGITVQLTEDIDLSGYQWKPIGTKDNIFAGKFHGQQHTIKNMTIGFPSADKSLEYVGLFGFMNAEITDIHLKDYSIRTVAVSGTNDIGGLAGCTAGGKIENCFLQGGEMEIAISHIMSTAGGFAGRSGSTINNCGVMDLKLTVKRANIFDSGESSSIGGFAGITSGAVTATKVERSTIETDDMSGGGFSGFIQAVKIRNCFSSATVKGYGRGSAGGFAFNVYDADLVNCYSTGNVSASDAGGFAYGISGDRLSISNCYSTGNVSGKQTSGFVVYVFGGKLQNCYASGDLSYPLNAGGSDNRMAGFMINATNRKVEISNCYYTGNLANETYMGKNSSAESGFCNQDRDYGIAQFKDNYSLTNIVSKNSDNSGGFGGNIKGDITFENNFYYSNIGRATVNSSQDGIARILEPDQVIAGKKNPITYTLHADDLPGGARVTSFRFDENLPGASVRKVSETKHEVTPQIDFGVLHLTGETTVSHAKLAEPTGDIPEGWDFRVSPADTTMQVSEDLLLCKIDYENEEILAPDLDGLMKNGKTGIKDAENNALRFEVQDGDFANIVPFSSPDLKCSLFIPERPAVPVVNCKVTAESADQLNTRLLIFATDREHSAFQEENAILPNVSYEYSLDGGTNYRRVTSGADGKIIIPLTASALSGWTGITGADSIKDARLRLAATEDSFRSKAMAEEAGFEVKPPEPSPEAYQVTYYWNDGTNLIYQADTSGDGKVNAPQPPKRTGYQFKGWYTGRTSEETGSYDFNQLLTADIKLYAHWESVTYTIKTDSNQKQGTVHRVYASSQDWSQAGAQGVFNEGDQIVLEAEAEDEAYTFRYWKCGEDIISDIPVFMMEVAKDQTLTAYFESDKPVFSPPAAPTYYWFSYSAISINVIPGQEYAIRRQGDISYGPWQTSGDFTGLDAATAYQIVARTTETGEYAASEPGQPLEFTTLKPDGLNSPILDQVDPENRSIHIMASPREEYAIRKKDTGDYGPWQTDGAFRGLDLSTSYQIVCRFAEIPGIQAAGPMSQPLEVFLPKRPNRSEPPAAPSLQAKTTKNITVNTLPGQEYAIRKSGKEYGGYQTEGLFKGLSAGTEYEIITRYAETAEVSASAASQPLKVFTETGACTVTFMDGGQIVDVQNIAPGGSAIAPILEKTGYQLTWSIPFDNVTRDMIVRAVWISRSYTIHFDANKGRLKSNNRKTVIYGRKYEDLPKPQRSGYRFNGWYSSKSGGKKISEGMEVEIEKDTTFYARWMKISLKKASLKSVKNKKGLKAEVSWNKLSNVDGYRVEYSTSSKFTRKTTKSMKISASKGNKREKTLSRLKKGKTYYIRVSGYAKDSTGKTLYGKRSTVKKVVIKK